MTRYNNWDEIPEELKEDIAEKFWRISYASRWKLNLIFIANGGLFQWAISQGLINKPEPVKGWFVRKPYPDFFGSYITFYREAIPLTYNPTDGTFTKESEE